MSRYEEFDAFIRTVEAGSFTAAAKQLRVAKSAISRRIQELEQRLGAQLLVRTTRKLTLTEDGEALFRRGKVLLEDWLEAEAVVSDRQDELSGTIRVAAPLSFGVAHLGLALLEFQKAHPNIQFDIDFSDRRVDLIAEGVDLAIRIGSLRDSSLIARKLAPIKMMVTASPAFWEENGIPKSVSDLKDLKELRYANRTESSWTFTDGEGRTESVALKTALTASNGTFLTQAAIAGMGVAIQPNFIIAQALRDGQLVRVLSDHALPELGLYAIYPPTRHLSKRVRTLVDFIATYFGDTPYWEQS